MNSNMTNNIENAIIATMRANMNDDGVNIYSQTRSADMCMYKASVLTKIFKIPSWQRPIDDDHVEEIYKYQSEYYNKYDDADFIHPVSIGICPTESNPDKNSISLIDGMHRVACAAKLLSEGRDIDINVIRYYRKNEEEIHDLYRRINSNKPVKLYSNQNEDIILNGFKRGMMDKYKQFIKTGDKQQTPNINLEKMISTIVSLKLIERLNISNADMLSELFVELNEFYSRQSMTFFRHNSYIEKERDIKWIKSKCTNKLNKEYPWYLGLYRNYEYLEFIIHSKLTNTPYDNFNHVTIKNDKPLSAAIRKTVWNHYFKTNIGECYVCKCKIAFERNKDTSDDIYSYECGHIKSKYHGGENKVDNLRPVCKTCNTSMGCCNMDEFINNIYHSRQL